MHTSAHCHCFNIDHGAVLVNTLRPKPLYIDEGVGLVNRLLQQAKGEKGLSGTSPDHQDKRLIDLLVRHQLLVEEEPPDLTHMTVSPPERMSLYLLVTQNCNLACTYCLAGNKSYRQAIQMTFSTAKTAITKAIQELSSGGHLEIVFFGGEPLLNWRLIKKICEWLDESQIGVANDCDIHLHITTNMTLMPKQVIGLIRRFGITLLTDIDGLKPQHNSLRPFVNGKGSFDKIIENINRLRENEINLAYRTTVTSQNVESLGQLARFYIGLGGHQISFPLLTPMDSDGHLVDDYLLFTADQYVDGLEKVLNAGVHVDSVDPLSRYHQHLSGCQNDPYNCGAPLGRTPVVTAAGKVYPCIYLVGQDCYEIGSIHSPSFSFWQNSVIEHLSRRFHVDHNLRCRSCEIRYLCRGGCPILHLSAETSSNNEKHSDYVEQMLCQMPAKILKNLLVRTVRDAKAHT